MNLRDLVFVLPLATLVPACATTPKHADADKPAATAPAAGATGTPGAAGATAAEKAKEEADEEKDNKADKLAKKNRELADARLELKITRQECDSEDRKVKDEVDETERDLKAATDDRDHFVKVEKELMLAKSKLSIDRAEFNVEKERQNLHELETMYKKDEFADLTKELVLNRGKKDVEFGVRELENARGESAAKSDFEIPKKLRELEDKVRKAEHAVRESRAKKTRAADEIELKMSKKEHAIEDIEKEIKKIQSKPDAKPPTPAQPTQPKAGTS